MPENALAEVQTSAKYSVRQFAPNSWGGFIGDSLGFLFPSSRDLLPAWGTTACDVALRMLYYAQHNGLVGGATEAWIEKYLSIPYEISGGRNLTYQWQDLFFQAEFGQGYDELMTPVLVDYLTLNRGAFIELVSYGDPSTPLKEDAKILGINHLDAMRVIITGNLEYPYLYQSEWGGGLHKMHATRVKRIVRQPSPNTLMWGMGKSALYDSISLSNAQVLLGKHQNEMLSDLPPPGIVIFNNIKPEEVETAMRQFDYERIRDGQNVYRAPLSMSSKDPTQPATVTFVPMSTMPEGFDYKEYMDTHVNMLALNYGLDPQDIWPLMGQAMGTGAQSKVLAAKTSTKGPGYLATRFERIWNVILPRPLEWKFKAQNSQQDKEEADIAKLWIDMANTAPLDKLEKRQLVANQVAAIADVIMDEQGNVRLPDDDPKAQGQEIIATDNIQLDAASVTPDVAANSEVQLAPTDGQVPPKDETKPVQKDIDATESAFVEEMQAAMQDGVDKVVSKASTAARIRGAIQRYGKQAYLDGLEHGGVDASEYSEDDALIVADKNVEDSQYVSDLVNEIYSDAGMSGTPESRAPLWLKTLDDFYYAGIASADANGMYQFTGDDGKESCVDCQRLKGVTHRMKWWVSNELRPGIDTDSFECGGWRCAHYLEKV